MHWYFGVLFYFARLLLFIMNKLVRCYTSPSAASSWWCIRASISWACWNSSLSRQETFNAASIFLVHQPSIKLSRGNIMMLWWIWLCLKEKIFYKCEIKKSALGYIAVGLIVCIGTKNVILTTYFNSNSSGILSSSSSTGPKLSGLPKLSAAELPASLPKPLF